MVKLETPRKGALRDVRKRRYGNALVARNGVGGTNRVALDRNKAEKPPGPRIAGVQDSGEAPGERRWLMAGVARRLMAEDRSGC
jgi:hypothetical protein